MKKKSFQKRMLAAIFASGLACLGTAGAAQAQFFSEDFEGLTLGPFVSPTEGGGDGTDWTATPPAGWTGDTTTTPVGGPVEFFGLTFMDKDAWIATAGNQARDSFTRGTGTVMVADGDEYDDSGEIDPDLFNAFMTTPKIDLTGHTNTEVFLSFDSSYRPYPSQRVVVDVSFDSGGTWSNLLEYTTANTPGGASSLVRANEAVELGIDTTSYNSTDQLQVRFGSLDTGNDWWWAVDNIEVNDEAAVPSLDIDRDTGVISYTHRGADMEIAAYSVTTGNGALDQTNWTAIADGDPDWLKLTAAGSNDDLSEATLEELNLADSDVLSFGDTWIQTPDEDITIEFLLSDNVTIVEVPGTYEGNGGNAFEVGDLDFDGDIDGADWDVYIAGVATDLSALSPAQAYAMGDMTGDLLNNHADFVAFQVAYDAANGAGAFQALISIPEPATLALLTLGVVPLMRRSSRTRKAHS